MTKKLVNVFVLMILCLIPLIIFPHGDDIYTHIKAMLLYFLCTAMIIVYCFKLTKENIKPSIIEYVLLVYFGLVFLSTIFSVDIYCSILGENYREEGFAAISCYIIIYFIASRYYNFSKKHLKYFFISAFIISLYGILQYLGFEFIEGNSFKNVASTIGNANFVGSYVTLVLPITIFSFLYTEKKIYMFLSSVLYLCMLCTYTRSAWVAFIVYIALLIYFSYKYKINYKKFFVIVPLFLCITIMFNLYDKGNIYFRLLSFYTDMHSNIEVGGSHRIFIWVRAVKLIPERPILGSGPDTFGHVFMDKYRKDVAKLLIVGVKVIIRDKDGNPIIRIYNIDKAHNEYLQMAVTTGVPSMIIYISFIILILYEGYKNLNTNKFIIPIFCSVIGYLVQAFFGISVIGVAPVYWALLGILTSLCNEEKHKKYVIYN